MVRGSVRPCLGHPAALLFAVEGIVPGAVMMPVPVRSQLIGPVTKHHDANPIAQTMAVWRKATS